LQRPEGSHQRPGLGQGLALAQQWVQRMGGSLDVRSAIGQGSTLTASVPLPTASEEEAAWQDSLQDDDPMPPLDGAGRCVWIVEDCAPVRELLCAHIEAQGFCAVPFAGGCDAIEHIARADTQPPQLIITDSHMPGADGRAVRAQARRRWPGLPVILLTAALDPSALAAQGFSAVLAKPVRRARLHAALEAALDRAARPAAATPPAPGGVRPARAHIARFVEMARFGAVSDIAECADALASTHTQWQPFLAQLKHSAERGDIKGCLDLLA
jgi:CheY-like chemotaxis protein